MPELITIPRLREEYRSGRLTPKMLIASVLSAADRAPMRSIWITRLSQDQLGKYAESLSQRPMDSLPLYGVPFAIKDNIDLAGIATTAGCEEFSYTPARSATVVQRLIDAGAIPIGKTNLDQFATGLVGTRSPYGACDNSFSADYISGGSSSGSAVAVALGIASFALGTDTAGSGRVPAAFNNVVGLKPSLGRLSTRGVVPACRSLDAVSIFSLTAADASVVLSAAQYFDSEDPYSRTVVERALRGKRCGVPRRSQLEFFGDADYERLFTETLATLRSLGVEAVELDFEPFLAAARLLYEGPWVAERYAAVGEFLQSHPRTGVPVTRTIIEAAKTRTAVDVFRGQYALAALKRACDSAWAMMDFMITPTAGTIYTKAAVDAEPLRLNSNLGYYTNFMNLLNLCGVAVPAGFRRDGLPFGVTLIGPEGTECGLLAWAEQLHGARVDRLGATQWPLPPPQARGGLLREGFISLAVCGAHMSGLPLNHQLVERGGYLLQATRTAAEYRLYALPGGPPHRPGLVRAEAGHSIAVEIWALPSASVGSFIAGVPAPLCLGCVQLADGSSSLGFLCESYVTANANDITKYGGWRRYLETLQSRQDNAVTDGF